MIKLKMREQSIQYPKEKKTKIAKKEEGLETAVTVLQDFLDSNKNVNQETKEASRELGEKKAELEKIIEHKTKGAILRAKCSWYNEGKKKYKILPKPREQTLYKWSY